jgi:hypothetical protein
MFNEPKPYVFKKMLPKTQDQLLAPESLQDTVLCAYLNLKKKAAERKRRKKRATSRCEPGLDDKVLAKCQPVSDAALDITGKCIRPYDGP